MIGNEVLNWPLDNHGAAAGDPSFGHQIGDTGETCCHRLALREFYVTEITGRRNDDGSVRCQGAGRR